MQNQTEARRTIGRRMAREITPVEMDQVGGGVVTEVHLKTYEAHNDDCNDHETDNLAN